MAKKKVVIKKKKPVVTTGPAPYARIRELGKERVDEINRRLLAGDPALHVAQWMVKEYVDHLPTVSAESLSKQLTRYKRDVLGAEVRAVYEGPEIPKKEATVALATLYGLTETVDGLSIMNEMVAVQRQRIWTMLSTEKNFPLGMEKMRKELRELFDMIKDFYELQFECGLIARVPKLTNHKVLGVMQHTKLGQTIDQEIQSHQEVTEATSAMLALLEKGDGEHVTS